MEERFSPPKRREFRDNCAPRTRGDHPDHHALSCLTLQGSIRSAPFVFILAGEIAIDRWPDLAPDRFAAGRLRMLVFARIECFRSSRPGAQRIARTLSVFEERSGSLVPSLKRRKARVWVSKSCSKTSQAPSFHLRRLVFARETLL